MVGGGSFVQTGLALVILAAAAPAVPASPSLLGVGLDDHVPAFSPSGTVEPVSSVEMLRVNNADGSRSTLIRVGGREIMHPHPYVTVMAQAGDGVLLEVADAGNSCNARGFVFLAISGEDLRFSDQFGECATFVRAETTGNTMIATLRAMQGGAGYLAYSYNGSRVTLRRIGLLPSAVPFGNADGWIGGDLFDYLTAAENHVMLKRMMGLENLEDARFSAAIASDFRIDGDWVVASGCRAHSCPGSKVAVAINRRTGRPVIALLGDKGRQIWGKESEEYFAEFSFN
ncbi:hypothetical protein GRI97_07045 [Altererythrobacter xixiisoli]|uniref:Uncharacterized protein n=1 Tax=Croceibacterium xixiisoli TaxID=1476466 RepID=A0A6I4TVW5_9SPHN|nr:hypothetical protein [Croceibacterium xixiisoli]MXO98738.1 hypothetical protein [Croceibacterium xixiisoli]